jgi:hypothetical protein
MNQKFIELTEKDDAKILINIFHIAWIEPNKAGSTITFNVPNQSFPKKVKESFEEIKAKLG